MRIQPQSRMVVRRIDIPAILEAHFLRVSLDTKVCRSLAAAGPRQKAGHRHHLRGGAQAMLIPPSVVLIVYGLAAQVSITRLFMALIGPGLLLATLYICYILFRARLNPRPAPVYDIPETGCLSSRGCPV